MITDEQWLEALIKAKKQKRYGNIIKCPLCLLIMKTHKLRSVDIAFKSCEKHIDKCILNKYFLAKYPHITKLELSCVELLSIYKRKSIARSPKTCKKILGEVIKWHKQEMKKND